MRTTTRVRGVRADARERTRLRPRPAACTVAAAAGRLRFTARFRFAAGAAAGAGAAAVVLATAADAATRVSAIGEEAPRGPCVDHCPRTQRDGTGTNVSDGSSGTTRFMLLMRDAVTHASAGWASRSAAAFMMPTMALQVMEEL